MEQTYESAIALASRATGPLAANLGPWVSSLIDKQYVAAVVYVKVRHAVAFDRWLAGQRVDLADLGEVHLTRYQERRRRVRRPIRATTWQKERSELVHLLHDLREQGLCPEARLDTTPADDLAVTGAHVRVIGKGRKERCTPLSKNTRAVLTAWVRQPPLVASQPLFPNARGGRLSSHGVQYLVAKHAVAASGVCPSLKHKRVSPHVLRHTTAMDLLQEGTEPIAIALWLGHESIETTQVYLDADLELKQKILDKTTPPTGKPGHYRPDDKLLAFLKGL